MMMQEYLERQQYRTPLNLLVAFILVLLFLNLPQDWAKIRSSVAMSVSEGGVRSHDPSEPPEAHFADTGQGQQSQSVGRFAGWPTAESINGSDRSLIMEWLQALYCNCGSLILIGLSVTLTVFFIQWLALSLPQCTCQFNQWRPFWISTLTTLLVAALVGRFLCGVSNDKQLRAMLEDKGMLYSADLPRVLVDILPRCLLRPILHVDSVKADNLSKDCLDHLTTETSLNQLHLRNCRISQRQWQGLAALPQLQVLRLENCSIEPTEEPIAISECHVVELEVKNCFGTEFIVSGLRTATDLRTCRIQQPTSDLELLLSSLNHSKITSLELVLTNAGGPGRREDGGPADALHAHVNGFANLVALGLTCAQDNMGGGDLHVEVSNCPQLTSLSVAKRAFWSLSLADLPRFQNLYAPGKATDAGGTAWPTLRALRIKNLQTLRKLELVSTEIQSFEVENCPMLQGLSLCPYVEGPLVAHAPDAHSPPPNSEEGKYGDSDRRLSPEQPTNLGDLLKKQHWLAQLRSLNLNYNKLTNVDLSFLNQLEQLKSLSLDETDVDVAQLTAGSVKPEMRQLSLKREWIQCSELNAILDHFPRLQSLNLKASVPDKLELVDRPELQTLEIQHSLAVNELRIENCPLLSCNLTLTQPLRSLRILNASSIQELYVAHPVPRGTVLSGISGLKEVYLAGSFLNDGHVESLLRCTDLELLFFSAPSVSPASLCKLRMCKKLTALRLPECQVSDMVVRALLSLTDLYELDLTRTSITHESLVALQQLPKIQLLWLSYTAIKPGELQPLCSIPKLFHLDLSGVGIASDCLERLVSQGRLERLCLADSNLGDNTIAALSRVRSKKLYLIDLSRCGLSGEGIASIQNAFPNASIETDTPAIDVPGMEVNRMQMVAR